MKIIGTAEDADRLLEVLMHIVPYINEVTKQMKSAAGCSQRAAEMKNVTDHGSAGQGGLYPVERIG